MFEFDDMTREEFEEELEQFKKELEIKEKPKELGKKVNEIKKDLVPIKYKLNITRDELWGLLNLVKMKADSYNSISLIKLAEDIIEKYKEDD